MLLSDSRFIMRQQVYTLTTDAIHNYALSIVLMYMYDVRYLSLHIVVTVFDHG